MMVVKVTIKVLVFSMSVSSPVFPYTYRVVCHITFVSLTKDNLDTILKHVTGVSKIPADVWRLEATPSDQRDPSGGADVEHLRICQVSNQCADYVFLELRYISQLKCSNQ